MKRVVLLATLGLALCAVSAQAKTVWLCNATRAHDLCKPDLTTTLLSNSGTARRRPPHPRPEDAL